MENQNNIEFVWQHSKSTIWVLDKKNWVEINDSLGQI